MMPDYATRQYLEFESRLADEIYLKRCPLSIHRIRELCEADLAGKVFISPCCIGDTVYILHRGKYPHLNSATVSGIHLRDETYRGGKKKREYIVVRKNGFSKHIPIDRIGKVCFLDEKSASEALSKAYSEMNQDEEKAD